MKPPAPRQAASGALPRDWAVPAIDRTNRAWFRSGMLALQECAACHVLQHPPEEICHVCGSMEFVTRTVAPTGTVHSYTIVHHAVHPALVLQPAVNTAAFNERDHFLQAADA